MSPARRFPSPPAKQRGVALLMAILVVALATVLAVSLQRDMSLDFRRVTTMTDIDAAFQYALGAEGWASEILKNDGEDSDTDHLNEDWAFDLPPLPIDDRGVLDGRIEDMQARYNINNLLDQENRSDERGLEQFKRLLEALEIDPRWAGQIADWLDEDVEPNFPDGAEDSMYTMQDPPYQSANMRITSTSELMLMPEMDRDTWEQLSPYIAALPSGTPININTATVPVIMSLSADMSRSDAESIVNDRPEDGYADVSEIGASVESDALAELSVSSSFFRATADIQVGSIQVTMYSLLERDAGNTVYPVIRSVGTP